MPYTDLHVQSNKPLTNLELNLTQHPLTQHPLTQHPLPHPSLELLLYFLLQVVPKKTLVEGIVCRLLFNNF